MPEEKAKELAYLKRQKANYERRIRTTQMQLDYVNKAIEKLENEK